jgi:hypothetical protein
MRCNLVFLALGQVSNRFVLCKMICLATRTLHHEPVSLQETINSTLTMVSNGTLKSAGASPAVKVVPVTIGAA